MRMPKLPVQVLCALVLCTAGCETQTNVVRSTTQSTHTSSVAVAANSRFAVTWMTQDHSFPRVVRAYVRAYDSAGKPVTAPIFLTPTSPATSGLNIPTAGSTPKVVIRDSGAFVVVYVETIHNPVSPELSNRIYFQRFTATGSAVGGRAFVDVGENPDIALTTAGFNISYIRYTSQGTFVHVRRFDDNGSSVGGRITVDTLASNDIRYIGSTHIRTRCTDEFIVLYHDNRPDSTLSDPKAHIRRFSAEGAPQGNRITLDSADSSSAFGDRAPGAARLVYLPTGGFNVITSAAGNYTLHRFDANGNPAAAPEFLFHSIDTPAMAANSCGDSIVAYHLTGTDHLSVREYSYAGTPVVVYPISQNALGHPTLPHGIAVSAGPTLFVTAWTRTVTNGFMDSVHRRWILSSFLNSGSNVRVCNFGCGGDDPCQKQAQIGSETVPGYSYQWSPATHLNNPNVANPVVRHPGGSKSFEITYTLAIQSACCKRERRVTVRFDNGCF